MRHFISEAKEQFSILAWRVRLVFWSGAILIGAVCAGFAIVSEHANQTFQYLASHWPWLPFILTPGALVAILWATRNWFPGAQGSGIPQAIAALQLEERSSLLSIRIAIGKILLTTLGLVCGASIGREGPSVHIGASLMHSLGRFAHFPAHYMERGLILAGGAAGIAAAFNTPMAGIVFAIEEMSKSFEQRTNGIVMTERRMDTAYHRQQVRHEGQADIPTQRNGQILPNLRLMTMTGNRIRLEALAGLRHQHRGIRAPAGTTDPGFTIGDQILDIHPTGFQQRQITERHGSRITPRVRDQARRPDRLAIHLRQAVHRFRDQPRAGMAHSIPLLPDGNILDAKIRRQIDDAHAGVEQGASLGHRNAIRRGEENQVTPTQRVDIRLGEEQIGMPPQVWIQIRDRAPSLGAGGDHTQRDTRVPDQQAQQFDPGIPGASDDSNLNHSTRLADPTYRLCFAVNVQTWTSQTAAAQ